MKEIISAVIFLVGLWGGTILLRDFGNSVRKAALEKAAQGLPSLVEMNRSLHKPRKKLNKNIYKRPEQN